MKAFFALAAAGAIALSTTVCAQPVGRTIQLVGDNARLAGTATLTEAPRGVLVRVQATGLTPGWHGMHFHSVATCADPGFKASGGHVHETDVVQPVHGILNDGETDLGDLPNIFAGPDGAATAEIFAPYVALGDTSGRLNLLDADGSALVIHALPDDHVTQPIGGAGARVICGAIK